MIFSRIWLINGLLAIALIVSALNIWDIWSETPEFFSRANSDSVEKQARPEKKIAQKRLNGEARYADIVDKNLFSPDRAPAPPETVAAEPEVEEVAEVKISGERVTLYGVIVLDNYKKALTNDPSDRAVDFRWISEGDKIGNLAVRGISEDNILLSDDEKSYRILLYDPEKIRKSGKQPEKAVAPKIVNIEGTKTQVTQSSSKAASSKSSGSSGNSSSGASVSSEEGEYKIIQTPFGDIKRKIK